MQEDFCEVRYRLFYYLHQNITDQVHMVKKIKKKEKKKKKRCYDWIRKTKEFLSEYDV